MGGSAGQFAYTCSDDTSSSGIISGAVSVAGGIGVLISDLLRRPGTGDLRTGVLRVPVFLAAVLRVAVFRAAVLRAGIFRAAVLRVPVFLAAVLRVAVFRAPVFLEAVLRVAVFWQPISELPISELRSCASRFCALRSSGLRFCAAFQVFGFLAWDHRCALRFAE